MQIRRRNMSFVPPKKLNISKTTPTARALATAMRTYHRPKEDGSTETWNEVVDRVISHQKWLWERSKGSSLSKEQEEELEELRLYIEGRYIAPAGRTLFLGGTKLSRKRESCMFNCSFTEVETVYDVVDVQWLLLQGCGVGFKPVPGILNGFKQPVSNIEIIRSKRTEKGGKESNTETYDKKQKHGPYK